MAYAYKYYRYLYTNMLEFIKYNLPTYFGFYVVGTYKYI